MSKIRLVIEIFGWVLFGCIYVGLIIGFLYWALETQNGGSFWWNLSLLGKIGIVILGIGIVSVYSILMLFMKMLFEALWIVMIKKILSIQDGLKKMKMEAIGNVPDED